MYGILSFDSEPVTPNRRLRMAEIVQEAASASQGLQTFEPEILAFCCEH